MSDVMLECRDVSIRYMVGDFKNIGLKEWLLRRLTGKYKVKEFWADCNVSFSLNRGDMLGIIGTNGAGKSTLLKAISGIMEPTRGKIIRRGRISALLELASGFDGDLTVKENAYLRGAMLGYTREFMDRTYPQILAFSELQEFEDRPFKQLSSGMKSRLAFAIASLVKPEILILDEVLSVGDGAFKAKSEAKMREIINGGVTTILVSHSIRQIQALCNKVLWLDHGRQVAFTDNVAYVCSCYERFLKAGVPVFVANDDADPDAASAPLVSVVMPVYNSGAYLREVVNSWLLQTFPGFELICVDDGSTDGSAEILGELKRDDSRICVVSQDHVGAAAARNRGLSLVNGEYVFFADSDDYVSSDLLEHMVAEARHTQAEIVVADHFVRRGTSERVVKLPNWLHELAMPISPAAEGMRILRAVGPMVWNKLFLVDHIRREGLVFKQHPLTDDLVFVFSAVCSAKRLSVAAGGYYHYRANRPGGQTASWCGVDGLSGLLDACMDLKEWMMRTGRSETYDYGFKQMLLGSMLHQLQAIDEKSFFDKAYCLFRKHALKEGLDELPVDLFGSAFEAKLFKLILDEPSSAAFCTAIVKAQNARENRLAKIDRALRLQQARIEGRLSDARLEVVSKTPLVSIPELPISSSASAYRSATVLGGLKQGEYYLFEADGTIVNSGGKVASLSIGLYEHQEGKTWIRYRVDRYRVYKKQNGMIRCVFKVPMVPGDWRLLVYAGRAGSTQGVSVSYHRVVVSKVAVRARLPVPVAVAEPPIGWAAYRSAVSKQIETALRLASARKEYHGLRSTLGADGVASEIGEVLFCDLKGVDK